ncbi:hypothetical protein NP493_405g02028 [Ridgeia piscesae]|uniref:Uncharacterized protein n=1 Tax=Ridgeia piscesae TaxID=27915 RepID=A0AAD9L0R7_RIDPI|nr:hypothetical protein NP493_405g02028 [Ridgeia piscesae]
MNEARRINIYCDADCEALTDVIMNYFTTGHLSDTEDDEQCDDSDNEVGLTKCVSVDNVSVDGSDINEEMSREELDIAILAQLPCGMHLSKITSHGRKEGTPRKTQRINFFHHRQRICRDIFKHMHGIGQDKLNALIKHYKVNGITPRQNENAKRLPSNALKMEDNAFVAHFLLNYAETHGMHLPGRVPGYWRADLKVLPTNCTERRVYDDYCTATAVTSHRTVSLVTFRRLWREIFCQKYQQKLSEAANKSDEEKAKLHNIASEHLGRVSKERAFYQNICKKTKDTLPAGMDIGRHDPYSYDGVMHYSMDFTQQVHYPSNLLQPGPVYFKTPWKCAIFGVACEVLPKQVTFLIDESVQNGKGANCVISLLHSYHEKYGMGETHMHLHTDNCAGQNNNSYLHSRSS